MVMLIEQEHNGNHNLFPKPKSLFLLTSKGAGQNKLRLCLFAAGHSWCSKKVEMSSFGELLVKQDVSMFNDELQELYYSKIPFIL